jgi:MFS family permease
MSQAMAAAPAARLSENRSFNIFWASQALVSLADSFAKISMPLLVLDITGSVAKMGLVTTIIGMGALAASISSNFYIDRLDRRKLMVACDFGRALFYLSIPLSGWLLGKELWPLFVAVGICSYLSTIFVITMTATVPSIVDSEHLTVGVSFVLGPMLAGVTSGKLGAGLAVGSISLLYTVSALLLSFVRFRWSPSAPEARRGGPVLQEVLGGVRFLLKHPVLKWVTLLFAVFAFLSEATIDLVIFRLEHDLQQDKGSIGLLFGLASLGAVIAGLTAHPLRRRWSFGVCYLGSLTLQGVAIIGLGLSPNLWLCVIMATMFTLGLMLRNTNTLSFRQEVTPEHLLGRVSAAFWTLIAVMGPFGALLATALAEVQGASRVLIGMGAAGTLVAIAGFFTPVRAGGSGVK